MQIYPDSNSNNHQVSDIIADDTELVSERERTGSWSWVRSPVCQCSECHMLNIWPSKYCPNCGIKMDDRPHGA